MKKQWDAIVVGAGVGGLALAALLAKVKKQRVLVLEKHTKPGGFTHTFKRKNYEFDIGVHYVGGLQEGSELRSVLKFLTTDKLTWRQLPYEFEKLIFSDFEWSIPSSRADHLQRLQDRFPSEKRHLADYFVLEKKIAEAYGLWQYSEKFLWPMRKSTQAYLRHFRAEMFEVTQSYFDRTFQDQTLKNILTARWMGFGLPPTKSSLGIHCVHSSHYAAGAWYPEEGGASIAEHLMAPIVAAGGRIALGTSVQEILVENDQVRGVKLERPFEGESEIPCATVISNAGARKTYLELLPKNVPIYFREKLAAADPGTSVISLFMGLKSSPRQMGFEAINYWMCPDQSGQLFRPAEKMGSQVSSFLSFPSLKQGASIHTAQVLLMTDDEFFKRWTGTRWRRRPEDYDRFKDDLIQRLLNDLDDRFPVFKQQVEYAEISTPLSVEHFHGIPGGAIYGVPSDPERLRSPWAQSRTPIQGLYLTGSDAFAPGISGAIYGALKTFELVSSTLNRSPSAGALRTRSDASQTYSLETQ